MLEEADSFINIFSPLILIIGGFFLGIFCEKIIQRKIKRITLKNKWEGDEIIIEALRGKVVVWFVLAGIYGAIFRVPLSTKMLMIIHNGLYVLLIISVTMFISHAAVGFVRLYSSKTEEVLHATSIFVNITKIIIYTIGGLTVLNSLGFSIAPLLTALGVGGLAVALAMQETLSNLFAGFQIIISKQVKPGDYVRLDGGQEGYVVDITWRNTAIRSLPNSMIIVPNHKLSSSIIINFYQPGKEINIGVQIGVDYNSDLDKVEKITLEIAREVMREVPGGVPEFEPSLRFHTLGDFSINFNVGFQVKEFTDQFLIKHEFLKRIQKRYQSEGIVIPYPIRTVHLKNKDE